jgi:MFS family permease
MLVASPPTPAGRVFQLLLVTAAVLAAAFAATTLGPLQETMRISLALSDNQMALLQGPARAMPLVVGAIPLGLLVDRQSRVRLVFIFAVVNVVASIGTALAYNFVLLFAARWLVGLAWAATLTAAISLIADLYAPAQRGRALMVMGIGQLAGTSAAFALGGSLVTIIGAGPNAWHWAMLWLTCPLIAVICLILAMREPPRRGVAIERPSARESFVELWRYRAVIAPLLGGVVIVDVAYGAAYIWAAPVFSRSFGLSPDRIGAIMAMVLLAGGPIGGVIAGILADLGQRSGGPRQTIVILTTLAFLSIPSGLFAVAPSLASAIVALVILLTILPAISVMVTTLFTVVIPNELRGLGTAVLNAVSVSFAYALAPMAVSLLSGAIGGPAMIGKAVALVCMTACVCGTATFAFGTRYFPRTDAVETLQTK